MLTRIKLAGYAIFLSWTLNTLGEWVGRLIWGSGNRLPGLSVFTAPVYLLTYIMFVMPLVGCCRAAWQLRFWYLMLLASVTWAMLLIAVIYSAAFHASPRDFLGPWPSEASPLWFLECATLSISIYLLLLRAAVRRVYGASRGNLIT